MYFTNKIHLFKSRQKAEPSEESSAAIAFRLTDQPAQCAFVQQSSHG